MRGYYDQVIIFMRALLSGGLKDNLHLAYGFLTGILRVAKESIFSGMNNLKVNSILDNRYSEYFGFTKEEVRDMATYYNALNKMDELAQWMFQCWRKGFANFCSRRLATMMHRMKRFTTVCC